MAIVIVLKNGEKIHVENKAPYEEEYYREYAKQFANKDCRAISVELDGTFHALKEMSVFCEDIKRIIRR